MSNSPRWRRRLAALPRLLVVMHDLMMVVVAWFGLHWLFYAWLPVEMPAVGKSDLLLLLLVQGAVFWWVGLYRGLWRFASKPDLHNILKATLLGTLLAMPLLYVHSGLSTLPYTAIAVYPVLLGALLGLPRFLYRTWKDYQESPRHQEHAIKVLILGAGAAANGLLKSMLDNSQFVAVGVLDDNPALKNREIQGIPVLGRLDDVVDVARATASEELLIAIPSLEGDALQRVLKLCEATGLPFRTLDKTLRENGRVPTLADLREVDIADLLGRPPVALDKAAIGEWLGGRYVMVTGAGGSIGAELCQQCAALGAGGIILLEQSELALLQIQQRLEQAFPALSIIPVLGNCGNAAVVRHALRKAPVHAIFHAAAYKHVPLLEGQLREALRNNALATWTVAREAAAARVSSFVLISTDKAVNPINVLGASKRLAELVCQHEASLCDTDFVTVRFGNVLDSAGSVVPIFREQIRKGGPVTVTHPDVTRYFMTIPEACQLILQAAAMGGHHAIYTLDMGAPVLIQHLAEQLIRLAGKRPHQDIAIVHSGLRPGEKLHEALYHEDEKRHQGTAHPKIMRRRVRENAADGLDVLLPQLNTVVDCYDEPAMAQLLQTAVPEFASTTLSTMAETAPETVS